MPEKAFPVLKKDLDTVEEIIRGCVVGIRLASYNKLLSSEEIRILSCYLNSISEVSKLASSCLQLDLKEISNA